MDLTPTELREAAALLELAAEEFSNHGCNDYGMEETPETLALAQAVMTSQGWEETDVVRYQYGDKPFVLTLDHNLMEYLAKRLREAAK